MKIKKTNFILKKLKQQKIQNRKTILIFLTKYIRVHILTLLKQKHFKNNILTKILKYM